MDEQPTFKVTDRRLFNADGSPRDVPPEETPGPKAVEQQPAAANASTTAAANASTANAPTAAPDAATAPNVATAPNTATAAAGAQTKTEPAAEAASEFEEFTEEELADARDPAGFLSFIMSIASNAASALGMMEHPVTHQREVDVELGKHWIDVLGMLQKKTAGNLTSKEQQMLEGLLADLRMQYVSLINSPQARRFSGSDITGGR